LIEQLKLEKLQKLLQQAVLWFRAQAAGSASPLSGTSIAHHAHEVSSSRAVIFFLQVRGIYSVKDNQCEEISYFSR
jgi:hypothetical protein